MKKTNRIFAFVLIFAMLFVNTVIISDAADDDISKTHFMVFIKEEYFSRVDEIIASVDCEYIGEVRELTNPDDYTSVYTPVLLIRVKDKVEDNFYKAQEYFFDKDYYDRALYDYLIGEFPDKKLERTMFTLIIEDEYAADIEEIVKGIDNKYIEAAEPADAYYSSSGEPLTAIYVYVKNGDEAKFSHAQQYFADKDYAEKIEYVYLKYNYDFILFGDADSDGVYTAADARFILRCSVSLEEYSSLVQCDADHDGEVTASDARTVLRYSVGIFD